MIFAILATQALPTALREANSEIARLFVQ